MHKVPETLLTDQVLDHLLSRICLVAPRDPTRPTPFPPEEPELPPRSDESEEEYACRLLAHRYGPHTNASRTTAAVVPLASLQSWHEWVRARLATAPPAPPQPSTHGHTLPLTVSASVDGPVPPRVAGMGPQGDVWAGSRAGIPLRQARSEPGLPALPPPYPPTTPPPTGATNLKNLFTPPLTSTSGTTHCSASSQLLVPGWVRERATEVLFEDATPRWGDHDGDPPLQWVVLDALRSLPIDLRKPLAEQMLVVGGVAMVPNLVHRLAQEVVWTLVQVPPARSLGPWGAGGASPVPSTARSRSRTAFLAGKHEPSPGGTELLPPQRTTAPRSTKPPPSPPPTRIQVLYSPLKPLVDHVGVLNDWGAGQPFGSSSRSTRSTRSTDPDLEAPQPQPPPPQPPPRVPRVPRAPSTAGSAPAFPPTIVPWIGASLSGALQLVSRRSVNREEWDASVLAAKEAADRLAQMAISSPIQPSDPTGPTGSTTVGA